jgi:DNA-binding MarR family transcriptional regulator
MPGTFDDVIHAPVRLRVCGMLAAVQAQDFAALRDGLGVADSVLSKHLARLQEAGYVATWKETDAGRARVWARLTDQGRRAFTGHVEALKAIAAGRSEG